MLCLRKAGNRKHRFGRRIFCGSPLMFGVPSGHIYRCGFLSHTFESNTNPSFRRVLDSLYYSSANERPREVVVAFVEPELVQERSCLFCHVPVGVQRLIQYGTSEEILTKRNMGVCEKKLATIKHCQPVSPAGV